MVEVIDSPREVTSNHLVTPKIKVIGIGGGGSNAVKRMFREPIRSVEYIAINTDAQALIHCNVPACVRIGDHLTRGQGVGGNPEMGRQSAEESREELQELVRGADLVFLAAGMGGGTGTGAIPVLANIAKEAGALTVAVVTKPFSFEGSRRRKVAEEAIQHLKDHVDTLIVIPNDRLSSLSEYQMTADQAFKKADEVLRQGVRTIVEIITVPGEINLDFADVKTIMSNAGPAWMGMGHGKGDNKAIDAAKSAITSPLLEVSIEGAKGVIFNVCGGPDLTLKEVYAAASIISETLDPEANIFFGMVNDPNMENEVNITLIATGFPMKDRVIPAKESNTAQTHTTQYRQEEPDLDIPPFLRRSPTANLKARAAT